VTRGRGGASAAVAAIALYAGAGAAGATLDVPGAPEGPLRVALMSTTPDDPLAGRIDAELGTIGFDVARAVVSPSTEIEEQVHAALEAGARAVIVADGHRTDVWIAEAGSRRVALRQELEVDETSGQQAILALRTVEFLRISLGLVSGPAVEPLASPPVVARRPPPPPAPPPRWVTVDATAGALAGSGSGGGTIAVAEIGVRAQLLGMIGAELRLYAPLTEAALANASGPVSTSVWMAGGGVLLAPRPDRRLSVEVAAGALAALVRAAGSTTPAPGGQYSGYTDQAVSPAFYGRGAARLRLVSQLALRIDLLGGALVFPPTFKIGNGSSAPTAVGTWGPAFAAGLGGAELSF
jgi:hypothetical protein